jgi:hypothetical protein
MLPNLEELVKTLDIRVFKVTTETSDADRVSLLRLQNLVADARPGYRYLEIGSHLGGSIFPHFVDARCASIVSVDPRPPSQPDERGKTFDYEGNSSARMIEVLSVAAGENAANKVRVIDQDIMEVSPAEVGQGIHFTLIDAEHTNRAAFRDFTCALRMIESNAIIAFHDSNLLVDALWNIEAFLSFIGRAHRGFYLPDVIYAVAFGNLIDTATAALGAYCLDPEGFYRSSKSSLWRMIAAREASANEFLPPRV